MLGIQSRLDETEGAVLGEWLMVERGALGGTHTLRRYHLHLYLVNTHATPKNPDVDRCATRRALSCHMHRPMDRRQCGQCGCRGTLLPAWIPCNFQHAARRSSVASEARERVAQVEALVDARVPAWATPRQPLSTAAWRAVTALSNPTALPRRLHLCVAVTHNQSSNNHNMCV